MWGRAGPGQLLAAVSAMCVGEGGGGGIGGAEIGGGRGGGVGIAEVPKAIGDSAGGIVGEGDHQWPKAAGRSSAKTGGRDQCSRTRGRIVAAAAIASQRNHI